MAPEYDLKEHLLQKATNSKPTKAMDANISTKNIYLSSILKKMVVCSCKMFVLSQLL